MKRVNWKKVDSMMMAGLLLVAFGLAIQFYAAWSIDFAFVTALESGSCVNIPIYGACIDLGAWWNTHFFFMFPFGAVLMIMGAYIMGRTVKNLELGVNI